MEQGLESSKYIHPGGIDVKVLPGSEIGWLRLTPSDRAPTSILKTRKQGLSLLREYTQGIQDFVVPQSRWKDRIFEVEKARGVSLQGIVEGDQNPAQFYAIPTSVKLKALEIYLQAVRVVNQRGDSIHDHNPDGIFLEYNENPQRIKVWLVDPGNLGKDQHKEKIESRQVTEAVSSTGLYKLLGSFFDRNIEGDSIPKSLRLLREKIDLDIKNHRLVKESIDDLITVVQLVGLEEIEQAEIWRKKVYSHFQSQGDQRINTSHEKQQEGVRRTYNEWVSERDGWVADFYKALITENNLAAAKINLELLIEEGINNMKVIEGNPQREIDFWRSFARNFRSLSSGLLSQRIESLFCKEGDVPDRQRQTVKISEFYQKLSECIKLSGNLDGIVGIHNLSLRLKIHGTE